MTHDQIATIFGRKDPDEMLAAAVALVQAGTRSDHLSTKDIEAQIALLKRVRLIRRSRSQAVAEA